MSCSVCGFWNVQNFRKMSLQEWIWTTYHPTNRMNEGFSTETQETFTKRALCTSTVNYSRSYEKTVQGSVSSARPWISVPKRHSLGLKSFRDEKNQFSLGPKKRKVVGKRDWRKRPKSHFPYSWVLRDPPFANKSTSLPNPFRLWHPTFSVAARR